MPYYKEGNILFIHIPKTGGSSLETYFKNIYTQTIFGFDTKNILPENINNISLQHLTYNTIYKYRDILDVSFNEKLNIITIVRNPYDRIISDLFWLKILKIGDSQEIVHKHIQTYLGDTDAYDNHRKPQYIFITDANENIIQGIKIFTTETLTLDMQNYGYTDFNIYENISTENSKKYHEYLNNDSRLLIYEFYKKDFELFKYNVVENVDTAQVA